VLYVAWEMTQASLRWIRLSQEHCGRPN